MLFALFVPLLAVFAEAAAVNPCAASCVSQAIAATGCSSVDSHCICSSGVFSTEHQECVGKACSEDEQASAISFAEDFCRGVSDLKPRWNGPSRGGRPQSYGGRQPKWSNWWHDKQSHRDKKHKDKGRHHDKNRRPDKGHHDKNKGDHHNPPHGYGPPHHEPPHHEPPHHEPPHHQPPHHEPPHHEPPHHEPPHHGPPPYHHTTKSRPHHTTKHHSTPHHTSTHHNPPPYHSTSHHTRPHPTRTHHTPTRYTPPPTNTAYY